jgi:hypothetical protein
MTTDGTRVPPGHNRIAAPRSRDAPVETDAARSDRSSVGWRDADWADEEHVVTTTDHSRAVVWGALAVVVLTLGGVLLTLLR